MSQAEWKEGCGDNRGILYGDGLFETVRIQEGRAFFLDRHIRRFSRSAEELDYPSEVVEEGCRALKSLCTKKDGLWRMTAIRPATCAPGGGQGGVFLRWRSLAPDEEAPRLKVLQGYYFPGNWLAEHKTTSWLRSLEARRRAEKAGYEEAIMVSPQGRVGEAAAANLFLWCGSRWITPKVDGILPGIVRAVVLERARQEGVLVEEREVDLVDLEKSTEVVLTSTRRLVTSAASIDGRSLRRERSDELRALMDR